MIIIKGRYNEVIVYTDDLEPVAAEQIKTLCDQKFTAGSRIRVMPDVHAGAGCTIGTTMTIDDKVVPNLVGVDIGCGMETSELEARDIDLKLLDRAIPKLIPSGFDIRREVHARGEDFPLEMLRCRKRMQMDTRRELRALGSLGGGNHFIEVDRAADGRLFLVVHSGSRHLGKIVAEYYQKEAWRHLTRWSATSRRELIESYKRSGRSQEIQEGLRRLKEQTATSDVPESLAYCEGDLFDDYIHDMRLVQRFAFENRRLITDLLLDAMGLVAVERFTTIHNYIDTDTMILRKGAVSAKKGEKLLIPLNMRDGALICIGKGNPEWNYSAPHGAGRLYSRTEARKRFDLDEFKQSMAGIYTTSVSRQTLDEAPMAYKPAEDIERFIADTVEITERVKPIYNFKAE